MDDIQSWPEVPSIAHFCSLFRAAFNLLDFDIEELEEALMTDGASDAVGSDAGASDGLLQELMVRLLRGCEGPSATITTANYQMFLRRLFRHKCQEQARDNPFNTDIDFRFLPLRTKVEILHALCDFRLDSEDVQDLLKNLESDSLRVEPLGFDENKSAYWYFYGTRLYREDFPRIKKRVKEKKRRRKEERRRKRSSGSVSAKTASASADEDEDDFLDKGPGVWRVVCFTEADWQALADKLAGTNSRVEEELHRTLVEDFLPELPRLFQEKERLQRKRLLEQPVTANARHHRRRAPDAIATERAILVLEPEEARRLRLERSERALRNDRIMMALSPCSVENENDDDNDDNDEYYSNNDRRRRRRKRRNDSDTLSDRTTVTSLSNKSVGRQTNNSLSCATGQIIIDSPRRKKLQSKLKIRSSLEDVRTGMYKVLDLVKDQEDAWPFLGPVDETYAPRYYSVIRHPMDLKRIEAKLNAGKYAGDLRAFRRDFQLIIDNCRQYNGSESEYTEMARTLQRVFEEAMARYLESSEDEEEEGEEEEEDEEEEEEGEDNDDVVDDEDVGVEIPDEKYEEGKDERGRSRGRTKHLKQRHMKQHRNNHRHRHRRNSSSSRKYTAVACDYNYDDDDEDRGNKDEEGDDDDSVQSTRLSSFKVPRRNRSTSTERSGSVPGSDFDDHEPDFLRERSPTSTRQLRSSRASSSRSRSPEDFQPPPAESSGEEDVPPLPVLRSSSSSPSRSPSPATPTSPKISDVSDDEEKKKKRKKDAVSIIVRRPGYVKNPVMLDSLARVFESTLCDITRWLDEASIQQQQPDYSSCSNSPMPSTAPSTSADDPSTSYQALSTPQSRRHHGEPRRRKLTIKTTSTLKQQQQQRRDVRTIERLQPGKSKGNLIANLPKPAIPSDELPSGGVAIGLGLGKIIKEARNALLVKTNDTAPKLSLGSVLSDLDIGKIGSNKAGGDAKEADEVALDTASATVPSPDKEKDKENDCLEKPKEKESLSPPEAERVAVKEITNKATPNLSAWIKAFGAPKAPTSNNTNNSTNSANTNSNSLKKNKDDSKPVKESWAPVTTCATTVTTPAPRRQRKVSSSSSVSEPSSLGQDSPLHVASPGLVSPRGEIPPPATTAPPSPLPLPNGTLRVGFYQDMSKSNSMSPEKQQSPLPSPNYYHVYPNPPSAPPPPHPSPLDFAPTPPIDYPSKSMYPVKKRIFNMEDLYERQQPPPAEYHPYAESDLQTTSSMIELNRRLSTIQEDSDGVFRKIPQNYAQLYHPQPHHHHHHHQQQQQQQQPYYKTYPDPVAEIGYQHQESMLPKNDTAVQKRTRKKPTRTADPVLEDPPYHHHQHQPQQQQQQYPQMPYPVSTAYGNTHPPAYPVQTSSYPGGTTFQHYVNLKQAEPNAIALKSAVPGSAFNFGPGLPAPPIYPTPDTSYQSYYHAMAHAHHPHPHHAPPSSYPSHPSSQAPPSSQASASAPQNAQAAPPPNTAQYVDPTSPIYQQYIHRFQEEQLRHSFSYAGSYALGIRPPWL